MKLYTSPLLLILNGLLGSSVGWAQRLPALAGQVVNEQRQPVPYATVGVPGTALGTAADEQGRFQLTVPDTLRPAARVIVSAVEYAPVATPVSAFRAGIQIVVLPKRVISLGEVVIRPDRAGTAVLGRTKSTARLTSSWYTAGNLISAAPAREVGTLLAVEQACQLQDFNFQVAFNTFRQVRVRLYLYRVEQGLPALPLVPAGIPVTVAQKRGWVSVDLREYHLQLAANQPLAATLRWEKDDTVTLHRHGFVLAAGKGRDQVLLARDSPNTPWQQTPGAAPVFYFTATTAAPPDSHLPTRASEGN